MSQKLDKNSFKAHTLRKAENLHKVYYRSLSPTERLIFAANLISVAFGFEG